MAPSETDTGCTLGDYYGEEIHFRDTSFTPHFQCLLLMAFWDNIR